MNDPVLGFFGDYAFLSNFFDAEITYNGIVWPTSEHAYQAMKTDNVDLQLAFLGLAKPGKAKKIGSKIQLRPHWELLKDEFMYQIVLCKFQHNQELQQLLLATGNRTLVELNNWGDVYWGMVRREDGTLYGKNKLGEILMRIRSNLRGEGLCL